MEEDPQFEVKFYEGVLKRAPGYIDAMIPLAEAYTRIGNYRKGLEIDQKLSMLFKNDPAVHYNLACSLALVGEKEKALDALERAIDLGYHDAAHMKKDPDLKSIAQEPRFRQFLKRLGGISA